jgi:hypothetical protein
MGQRNRESRAKGSPLQVRLDPVNEPEGASPKPFSLAAQIATAELRELLPLMF